MAGSDESHEVTIEDLAAFASLRASEDTRRRVIEAMSDRNHPLSDLVRPESDVLDEQDESVGRQQQQESDEAESVDDIVHREFESLIEDYLTWEESQLNDRLAGYVPESEAVLVRRSGGRTSPLKPYLDEIRRVVCLEWGWCNRRDDGALNEPVNLVIALADAFVVSGSQIPFPPTLLAVSLVKIGLDRLCRERKT